jgi:ubiquinone/menaquinone biosynthesis C-methylase UbiE
VSIAGRIAPGARVLEIAPGPGYLAIELAKLGPYRIDGIDISRSFVRIANENAARAGVEVAFRQGDAAALPYPAGSFAFVVCRAAFKNFRDPVRAVCEMHRVLAPDGEACIIDMRRDASDVAVDNVVDEMGLGWFDAMLTRNIFKRQLRKRAYEAQDFRDMAEGSPFGRCTIDEGEFGLEVYLRKEADNQESSNLST